MRFFSVVILMAAGQPCFAQATDPATDLAPAAVRPAAAGWSVTIGLAPVVSPAWQGSNDMVLSIFPDVRVAYGDDLFASVPDGIGWNALNQGGWKAGPLAKVRFGRDEDGKGSPFVVSGQSDALRGLGDIDATDELGGFVDKRFGAGVARPPGGPARLRRA